MSVKVPITGIVTELNFVIRTCSILCYPKTKIVFRLTITKFIIQNLNSDWSKDKIFEKKAFQSKSADFLHFYWSAKLNFKTRDIHSKSAKMETLLYFLLKQPSLV